MKLGRRQVAFAWGFTKTDKCLFEGARMRDSVAKVTPTEAVPLYLGKIKAI